MTRAEKQILKNQKVIMEALLLTDEVKVKYVADYDLKQQVHETTKLLKDGE